MLEEATGINDAGQIVDAGTKNGQTRAFLLNPQQAALVPGSVMISP